MVECYMAEEENKYFSRLLARVKPIDFSSYYKDHSNMYLTWMYPLLQAHRNILNNLEKSNLTLSKYYFFFFSKFELGISLMNLKFVINFLILETYGSFMITCALMTHSQSLVNYYDLLNKV